MAVHLAGAAPVCQPTPFPLLLLCACSRYGKPRSFFGQVVTLQIPDSHNSIVSLASAEAGAGRVMVVCNAGSLRSAVLGDAVAERALSHGWAGILVNGCIRDADTIAT